MVFSIPPTAMMLYASNCYFRLLYSILSLSRVHQNTRLERKKQIHLFLCGLVGLGVFGNLCIKLASDV